KSAENLDDPSTRYSPGRSPFVACAVISTGPALTTSMRPSSSGGIVKVRLYDCGPSLSISSKLMKSRGSNMADFASNAALPDSISPRYGPEASRGRSPQKPQHQ